MWAAAWCANTMPRLPRQKQNHLETAVTQRPQALCTQLRVSGRAIQAEKQLNGTVEVLQTLHGAASDTPWVATWCNGLYLPRPAFLFFMLSTYLIYKYNL
jgi:hypothetical protein